MNKFTFALISSLVLLTASSSAALAQTNMCNQRCDVDNDCGSGYRCYVGVCRLDLCPAASSCSCGAAVNATPTVSPKASTVPTPTPKAVVTPRPTATPKPTATPRVIASTSAGLTHTPKTGASSWMMAGMAGILFLAGASLAGFDARRSS